MTALVTASTPADGVRVLALNRPEKRNALSQAMIKDLLRELSTASADNSVRAIVLTGSKTFFSAGADISEISDLDAESARQCRYLEDLCHGLAAVRKPLIAAVEGIALGGGFEVVLACDLIYASESSRFGLPEVSLGLIPGAGGTQRLSSAVGKFRAMKMVLTGAQMSSNEALACGLVSEITADGTVLERAVGEASSLASKCASALSLAKQAICRQDDLSRDDDFERNLYYYAFGTWGKREGVSAFLEKRTPLWIGPNSD